ncbi:uncharacterized protein B0H18DRAFT_1122843 [Fomitopsis serialis]|uniref:uncharacterized protein n=1 Tax=Fomitopsis serialis TaxID=139415 RepID=UPI002007E2B7|nr:uncharacterized protein B0H18DRAFT_1122843 [Neoantrodia serialis]KAH9918876.1 hypothetical protein B0H18DRAFT_1122843 [Neoantrodia serialis]
MPGALFSEPEPNAQEMAELEWPTCPTASAHASLTILQSSTTPGSAPPSLLAPSSRVSHAYSRYECDPGLVTSRLPLPSQHPVFRPRQGLSDAPGRHPPLSTTPPHNLDKPPVSQSSSSSLAYRAPCPTLACPLARPLTHPPLASRAPPRGSSLRPTCPLVRSYLLIHLPALALLLARMCAPARPWLLARAPALACLLSPTYSRPPALVHPLQPTENAAHGTQKEEEEKGRKREEGEGHVTSRKNEHEGSTNAGTPSLAVLASPSPFPVSAPVGVSTNAKLAVFLATKTALPLSGWTSPSYPLLHTVARLARKAARQTCPFFCYCRASRCTNEREARCAFCWP